MDTTTERMEEHPQEGCVAKLPVLDCKKRKEKPRSKNRRNAIWGNSQHQKCNGIDHFGTEPLLGTQEMSATCQVSARFTD